MASAKKVKLCSISDLNEGDIKGFKVENKNIMVIKFNGKIYVYDALCTHKNCNLVRMGLLKDNKIVCICHSSEFNIESGEPINGLAKKPLIRYDFIIEDGSVNVIIP
ncbi:Rieske (2Fe-2S) protein [Sulfolobus tengchongensis]|uniref:Rieske (2Fe-2S) protein n=1 Tax=Sulfolobus tengchongensis TaxID=207809 RepID=A0AAX4L2L8_9CREN